MKQARFMCGQAGIFLVLGLMMMMLATAGRAQISAPQNVDITILKFDWENTTGTLASQVVLNNNRPDTLSEMGIRVMVQDTLGDSSRVVLNVTTWMKGYANYVEKDTVPLWAECPLPRKGGGSGRVPDSLFYFYFNNQALTMAEDMRATLTPVDPDQSYLQMITFANDTIFGTKVDTSDTIYLGPGVKNAVFGYYSAGTTPEATYEVLYNLGHGWGLANPSDTLAEKTWTDDAPANAWLFRDAGELLNGIVCKIIRHGEAAADTTYTRQSLRLYPR